MSVGQNEQIRDFFKTVLKVIQWWLDRFVPDFLIAYDECQSKPKLIYVSSQHAIAMSGFEIIDLLFFVLGASAAFGLVSKAD